MSAHSVVRNDEGVLLRYSVDTPLPAQRKVQPSDRERLLLIKAQRALRLLSTVIECMQLNDVAPIDRAIDIIESALDEKRERLSMAKAP